MSNGIQAKPFRLLSMGKVSRILGVDRLTISKAYDRGDFKGYRTPGGWRKIWCWSVRKHMKDYGVPERFLENPPRKEDILRPKEAGIMLGVGRTTVNKLIDSGQLEGWRINTPRKERRTHREAVQEFLRERENK